MRQSRVRAGAGALLVVALLMPQLLLAQAPTVQLLYDEGGLLGDKKTAAVQLTDPEGDIPPDTGAVRTDDRVHFRYEPVGDWSFSDDATETLQQIAIQQEGTRIQSVEATLLGGGDDATAARVAYPREKIEWLQSLAFSHEVDTSATFSLPEVYAADYPTLRRPYDRGRQLLEEGEPRQALDTLSVFYGEEMPDYRFISDAKTALDKAAKAIVAQEREAFGRIREKVVSSPDAATLERIEAFRTQLDTVQATLDTYLTARPDAGAAITERIADMDTSAVTLYENAYATYRQQTTRVFLDSPYSRDKPAFFIDVLARLLLNPDPALAASNLQLDSLSTDLLTEARYDDVRRTLRQERWWRDFQDVVTVVANNLQRHDRIFGEKVFQSLRLTRTAATQPYYEILSALNAAAAGDASTFQTRWERARTTCTDLGLLNAMQHWHLALRTAPPDDTASVATLVEEAQRLRTEKRLETARQRLDRASRMAPDYAPLLYEQGRLHQAQGDTTTAQKHFERAHAADTTYVVPEVATLRLLLDQEQSEQALEQANTTLQSAPYWPVYFAKARALGQLERYNEAVNVLRERCEQLNEKSYALYALMAELYVNEEAWKGAAWAVNEADSYEPARRGFVSRLLSAREQVEATDKVSLDEVRNAPGASGP